jgi:hypothetical protein
MEKFGSGINIPDPQHSMYHRVLLQMQFDAIPICKELPNTSQKFKFSKKTFQEGVNIHQRRGNRASLSVPVCCMRPGNSRQGEPRDFERCIWLRAWNICVLMVSVR